MLWQKILAVILALVLSDLYILAFKKILPLWEKRMNASRHRENEQFGKNLPDIRYPKSFVTRYSLIIITCVIMGILMAFFDKNNGYLIPMLRSMFSYGTGFLSIVCIISMFIGKIKRIYYQVKEDDPFYYVAYDPEDYEDEENENQEADFDEIKSHFTSEDDGKPADEVVESLEEQITDDFSAKQYDESTEEMEEPEDEK